MFKQAVKTESKLRLAFTGPAGSGKTYSSLAVATALVPGGRVALLDTEHGSAAKYADIFTFDTVEMESSFHPDRYVEVINAAVTGGYDALILDSMSHAWTGQGGMLDVVNDIARARYNNNTFMAWKDGGVIQNRLIEAILTAPIHIIATMRSKTEYAVEMNERGKQQPRKIGTAPVQRDGFEYEYDVIIDMGIDNVGIVNKTRCPALTGKVIDKPGAPLAATLREWLHGAPPPPVQQYKDGSTVGAKERAYYQQHIDATGDAPENVDALREWYKAHKNGNGNGGTPQPPGKQPALITEDPAAKQAALDTAQGRLG